MSFSLASNNCDLLTIGSGPVGLMQSIHTALICALEGRKINVVMLDKRTEFVRGHTVNVGTDAVKELAIKTNSVAFNTADQSLRGHVVTFNGLVQSFKGNTPIADIETKLDNFAATELGFTFKKGKKFGISDDQDEDQHIDKFINEYNPKVVITAGGARCVATQQIFGKDHRDGEKVLGHFAQMKFTSPAKPREPNISMRSVNIAKPKLLSLFSKYVKVLISNAKRGFYSTIPIISRKVSDEGTVKGQVFVAITGDEARNMQDSNAFN